MKKTKPSKQIVRGKLMCYQCLPPKPMKDHVSYRGIIVHERVDCPPDTLYMVNEDSFKLK